MTVTTSTQADLPPSPARRSPSWSRWVPALVGSAYTAAWIVGLSVSPSNLAVNSTGTEVVASYRGHSAAVSLQLLLVEGLAGILLGSVVLLVGRSLRNPARQAGRAGVVRAAVAAGLGAALVSVTQCVVGLAGVSAAGSGNDSTTGTLFSLVNRLDGVKMLLIACAAVGLALGMRTSARWPGWLAGLGFALAATMVFSAVSYLFLLQGIAWAVYLDGPLLLIWMTASAVRVSLNAGEGRRGPVTAGS